MPVFSEEESPPDHATTWNQFRDQSLADVKTAAEYCFHHAEEHYEYAKEHSLINSLKQAAHTSEEARRLAFRGGALSLLVSYMVRHGPNGVPRWEDLHPEEKKQLMEVTNSSSQVPRKTRRAAEAMIDYFDQTPLDEVPEQKGDFFDKIAAKNGVRGSGEQIWNRVDTYCRDHDINVPSDPNGYREILN